MVLAHVNGTGRFFEKSGATMRNEELEGLSVLVTACNPISPVLPTLESWEQICVPILDFYFAFGKVQIPLCRLHDSSPCFATCISRGETDWAPIG